MKARFFGWLFTFPPSSIFVFLLFLLAGSVGAQSADSLRPADLPLGIIDTIIVLGNQRTKEYVILDEMTLQRGMEATSEAIEFDRSRIYSLGLFNRVDLWYDSLDGKGIVHIDVSERWYIIPLPVFGFAEGDPKKPYYGGGVLHNNFRGRNQKLFGLVTFGYNPSLALSFRDPQVNREHNLYFAGGLSYVRVRNKSEREASITGDFDELHYNLNATLGKRFTLYETVGFSFGYEIVHIKDYRPGRTVSTDGRDAFLLGSLSYVFDSRDLREYASDGRFLYVGVTKYGFGESELSFIRLNLDVRRYVPLFSEFTIAGRVHGTVVSGGLIPTYARAYFGYGEKIRGYFDTIFEGEDMLGASVELRYPLLKARTIHFTAIPLPPEFSVWRFGIGLALFGDTGVTWFRGEGIQWTDFSSGYGAGIHFLLPYSIVLRTEYAWNELFEGQFILDLKASF